MKCREESLCRCSKQCPTPAVRILFPLPFHLFAIVKKSCKSSLILLILLNAFPWTCCNESL